jgi:hypothetical protein
MKQTLIEIKGEELSLNFIAISKKSAKAYMDSGWGDNEPDEIFDGTDSESGLVTAVIFAGGKKQLSVCAEDGPSPYYHDLSAKPRKWYLVQETLSKGAKLALTIDSKFQNSTLSARVCCNQLNGAEFKTLELTYDNQEFEYLGSTPSATSFYLISPDGVRHEIGPTLDESPEVVTTSVNADSCLSRAMAQKWMSDYFAVNLRDYAKIDDDAAAVLAGSDRDSLDLEGLVTISDKSAAALAGFKGTTLSLRAVKRLTDASIASLAKFKGSDLNLDSLESINEAAASSLARFGGQYLLLTGVVSLSDEAAATIAQFKQRMYINPKVIVSPKARKLLASKANIILT